MAQVQVLTPNPNVPCIPGDCLKYVSDAFGITADDAAGNQVSLIPHTNYGEAIEAWNASIKHQDQKFPAGMWVPVWFSLARVAAGHVALRAPDGSIYSSSSPRGKQPVHHPSLAALFAYYAQANPLTYLGWSEDIGGTRVITNDGDLDMIGDTDNEYGRWAKLGYQIRGRSLTREEFHASAVGQTWLHAMEILSDDPEADAATHAQEVGQTALKDDWQDQITTLQGQVQTVTADDAAVKQQLTQAQTDLATEKTKSAGLAKNLDDSQLALDGANKQLVQAESLAQDDDAKIKDLTAKLSTAQATIDQLQTQADKPPASNSQPTQTPVSPSTPTSTAPQTWLEWLVSFIRGRK